jgi:hypothetical protein
MTNRKEAKMERELGRSFLEILQDRRILNQKRREHDAKVRIAENLAKKITLLTVPF